MYLRWTQMILCGGTKNSFGSSKTKFKKILAKYPMIEQKELDAFLDEKEVSNIDYYGYGFKSYTLSMIEAIVELTDGQVKAKIFPKFWLCSNIRCTANWKSLSVFAKP